MNERQKQVMLEDLKTQIQEEEEYIFKLDQEAEKKFENLDNKFIRTTYLGGKVERIKEDIEWYTRGNDKRHFVRNELVKEIQRASRSLRIKKSKLRLLKSKSFHSSFEDEEYEDDY